MLDLDSNAHTEEKNVHGWERASSLAGGALMISKGMRHGGVIGLLQVAVVAASSSGIPASEG